MNKNTIFPYRLKINLQRLNDEIRASLPESVRDNAFVFQIEGSNVNLDSYFTHMTRKTLTNFSRDATAGVQFLDSHNNRNLGYGRTFGGRVRIDSEREPLFDVPAGVELAVSPPSQYAWFQGDVYTVPGINFGGGLTYGSTDDFIRALDAGLAADVSVGFGGGDWRCDICGENYRSYRACPHYAGQIYPAGEAGDRQILATVAIDGARLHEVSAVYDGATPNATILKARAAAEDGELSTDDKRFLEVRYKVDIPSGRIFPVTNVFSNGRQADDLEDIHMADERKYEAALAAVREVLAETGADESLELPDQVRWLVGEVERLRPLADEGRQYRNDLIEDALKEGVRAMGDRFNQEAYRGLLGQSSLEVIKQMRGDWAEIAGKRWPNGRQTEDEGSQEPAEPLELIPDSAYQA